MTGLSRAGKTVFLTALINNLIAGARLPVLAASAEGRIMRVRLEPQPDDAVPRFAYEEHLKIHSGPDRRWPESTRRIAELRLTIEFESASAWGARRSSLINDIVDYPGEWLLDLPLLDKSYATWCANASRKRDPRRAASRNHGARRWSASIPTPTPTRTRRGASPNCSPLTKRARRRGLCALHLAARPVPDAPAISPASPALTFAPIPLGDGAAIARLARGDDGARRYEAYKAHGAAVLSRSFARLDRQIVLVDALPRRSIPGPWRRARISRTFTRRHRRAFRAGRSSYLASIFRPRIDRILFAATKADHLHHKSHDRLEAILRSLTAKAIGRVEGVGAEIDVIALAAVRATREAEIRTGGEALDAHRRAGEGRDDRRADVRSARGSGRLSRGIAGRPWRCAIFEGDAIDCAARNPTTTGGSCASRPPLLRGEPRRTSGSTARCNS